MAKTIKFNLICDGYPVRTLDDLCEHFSIEDILEHHKSGMLARWLEVRGYEKELVEINGVSSLDRLNAAKRLVQIFQIEVNPEKIEMITQLLDYEDLRKQQNQYYLNNKDKVKRMFTEYVASYQAWKEIMVENNGSPSALKTAILDFTEMFMPIFELDYRNLFLYLEKKSPLAIFYMLAHESLRTKYVLDQNVTESAPEPGVDVDEMECRMAIDINTLNNRVASLVQETYSSISVRDVFIAEFLAGASQDKLVGLLERNNTAKRPASYDDRTLKKYYRRFYDEIMPKNKCYSDTDVLNKKLRGIVNMPPIKLRDYFGDNLKKVDGDTKGNWKEQEAKGKKCLILKVSGKCCIRSLGFGNQEYEGSEANDQFIILDGLDYQSADKNAVVYYLEV